MKREDEQEMQQLGDTHNSGGEQEGIDMLKLAVLKCNFLEDHKDTSYTHQNLVENISGTFSLADPRI